MGGGGGGGGGVGGQVMSITRPQRLNILERERKGAGGGMWEWGHTPRFAFRHPSSKLCHNWLRL